MKQLPSLFALALLGTVACAQTPAPGTTPAPGAPATPPAATPPAAGTPSAANGAGAAAKVKPFPSGDLPKIKDFKEALQFNYKMGEIAKSHGKDDKDLGNLGNRVYKEATDYITPLTNLAQAHGVDAKYLPSDVSASDKMAIDKLGKAKPDKWKLEFLDLFSKETKRNAHSIDAAAKAFTDTELKELATKAAKLFDEDADALEKMYKDLKNPKKEVKK